MSDFKKQNLIFDIARLFSLELVKFLETKDLHEAIRKNQTDEYQDCCATHDYCDSNMFMAMTLNDVGFYFDREPEKFTDLWNSSWDMAKKNNFFCKVEECG